MVEWSKKESQMAEKVDVCVVGGGIAGLFTAMYAARAGMSVRLIDRVYISGSRFNIGAVLHQGHSKHEDEIMQHSYKLWSEDAQAMGFETRGSLQMLCGVEEVKESYREMKSAVANGLNSMMHTDLNALSEAMGGHELSDRVLAARSTPEDSMVETNMALDRVRQEFIRAGGRVWGSDEVAKILQEDGRVIGVETVSGDVCHAKSTAILAGAWAGVLIGSVGAHVPLRPARAHAMQLSTSRSMPEEMLIRQFKTGRLVAKYEPRFGRVLVIYDGLMDQAQATWSNEPDPEAVEWMQRQIPTLLPVLETATVNSVSTITLAVTPDLRPCIGTWPGIEGLYIGVGWNGKDYGYAPSVGDNLVRLMQGKESAIDLAPFSVNRFVK
jgi:sarcosine oxidase subunit beta